MVNGENIRIDGGAHAGAKLQSLPVGAPLVVDAIFEIEPTRQSSTKWESSHG